MNWKTSSWIRPVLLTLLLLLGAPAALANQGPPVEVSSSVSYQLVARWDAERLNRILVPDTPSFAGINVFYTPARHAVDLYRISYDSVIPERGNKPTRASGLLAIPDTEKRSWPMVSYQHGTVYGHNEVGCRKL